MPTSLMGIELEMGGVLIKFRETGEETNGALHVQEARYPARSAPPPMHRHRKQEERFQILEGALDFRVGDEKRTVTAGEELVVPRGALHRAFNPGDTSTLVIWETRPALRTAEFFFSMDRASRGKGRARPRLTDAAAILREFRDEFELAKPPPFVQRIVFGCLAPFAPDAVRRLRY